MRLLTFAFFALPSVAAAAPCGGVNFNNGSVATASALPLSDQFDAAAQECLQAIADGLKGRPSLRTVTIAVRLPDAQRLEGAGTRIANAYTAALVAGGIPASRISGVAPAAGATEAGRVTIAFTEKSSAQPVGLAESVGGQVLAGGSLDGLQPIATGAMIASNTYVKALPGGNVALGLADGSRIRLPEKSTILIGNIFLNEDLRRSVELRMVEGDAEFRVAPGGDGSKFDVATRTGVAGVRGTVFRLSQDEGQGEGLRLETLEGAVELSHATDDTAEAEKIMVNAGQALVARDDQPAGAPRDLLPEPAVREPLFGDLDVRGELLWTAVGGAKRYQVLLARDAEFTLEVREVEAGKARLPVSKDLPEGKWFWRVAGVDEAGYAGLPSRIYSFTLKR